MSIFCNPVITHSRFISPPLCLALRSCSTSFIPPTMPQKRAESSGKRKGGSDSDGERPEVSIKRKKAKESASSSADDTGLAPNGQPTNKVLPIKISFPSRAENTSRIASWNICGLASSQKKVCSRDKCPAHQEYLSTIQGFKYYVEAEDPDILILTETKVNCDYVACARHG
jgi:AP endonuclease 1